MACAMVSSKPGTASLWPQGLNTNLKKMRNTNLKYASSIRKAQKSPPPQLLPYSPDLQRFIKTNQNNYDLIITSETFSLQSYYAARVCPEKTVIWHELGEHQRKFYKLPSKLWYNIAARFMMKRVACVVPRSEKARTFISRYMPRVTPPVDHGIDIRKFQPSRDKKRQFISSSQLITRKRVDGIIRTFAGFIAQPQHSDFRLIIAGRGSEKENLERLVERLGIKNNVEFTGFLPQAKLNEYIRESMAFLINTDRDLNMISVPEAICSGTPVITTSVPYTAPTVQNHKLGLVKDNWGVKELNEIVEHNAGYVDNCINHREKLSNVAAAREIIGRYIAAKRP